MAKSERTSKRFRDLLLAAVGSLYRELWRIAVKNRVNECLVKMLTRPQVWSGMPSNEVFV